MTKKPEKRPDRRQPEDVDTMLGGYPMIRVPKGSFMMGSPPDEPDRFSEEIYHRAHVIDDFYIGKFVVTQALWFRVMGTKPSGPFRPMHPVVNITWYDAVNFCNAFTRMVQLESLGRLEPMDEVYVIEGEGVKIRRNATGFRLPTEVEWEYAARGGEKFRYAGSDNPDEVAWHSGNASDLQPVGQKAPNGHGLYDMSGNVWEWCEDIYGAYIRPRTLVFKRVTSPWRVVPA